MESSKNSVELKVGSLPSIVYVILVAIESGFKFVINDPAADINEIWRKYVEDEEGINLDCDRIWFMPVAGSRKEHIENAAAVVEYAKSMHVNFSARLHLLVWDMALKV